MSKHHQLLALPLALLALACGEPSSRVRVTTNGSVFDIVSNPGPAGIGTASIPYEVTNLGEQTIYLSTCGDQLDPAIDRSTGSGWEQYAGGFCLANRTSVAMRVVKGDRRTGTVTILAPGIYRIHFYYTTERSDNGEEASKPFEVR